MLVSSRVGFSGPASSSGFGRACSPWNDFVRDATRLKWAGELYLATYGVPLPERVANLIRKEGFCSKASVGKQVADNPPRPGDVASPDAPPAPAAPPPPSPEEVALIAQIEQAQQASRFVPGKKKVPTWAWVAGGIGAAVLVVGGVFVATAKGKRR